MLGSLRRRLGLTLISLPYTTHFLTRTQHPSQLGYSNPASCSCPYSNSIIMESPSRSISFTGFSSYTDAKLCGEREDDEEGETSESDDADALNKEISSTDEGFARDIDTILGILNDHGRNKLQVKNKLDECRSVTISPELVVEVLSRVRNDWETAFTFFLWAKNKPNYRNSLRAYHSMISILAKVRKFDTAWALIDEMRGESLVTPHTLLIMIRRYCAVHEVAKAINTFYAHRLFKFNVGMEEFHSLLSALCRYKNVKDAEHLLFCNENFFSFNTKSFNIILNGWCNIVSDPREAKRIWREMAEKGVDRDVVSYSSIISCYSKHGNLHEALKLFNQMKELDIALDRKVYNAVIHALAKKRLVKDACDLLKTMEESGIAPNAVSYNSLIKPLCTSGQLQEAAKVFGIMLEQGVSPTIRTYHALLRNLKSKEEVCSLLDKMNKTGLCPDNDTKVMLVRKFLRWGQVDDAWKIWNEMRDNGGSDRSAYVALVKGLFLSGELEEAHKHYDEMKAKDYLPEPELDKLLQSCLS